ncbi:hypothetical protein BDZ91DRAFT_500272 [Kalaharituber pfeilii]|nr:hypothetical protein BDZ91DRAFT_500272 [Kalaharituber pfeilii]
MEVLVLCPAFPLFVPGQRLERNGFESVKSEATLSHVPMGLICAAKLKWCSCHIPLSQVEYGTGSVCITAHRQRRGGVLASRLPARRHAF